MTTALFCPPKYTGTFVSIAHLNDHWRVVFWQFGVPLRYTPHSDIIEAVLEVVRGGMRWASEGERAIFDADVIMAMEV